MLRRIRPGERASFGQFMHFRVLLCGLIGLAACTAPSVAPPSRGDLAIEVVRVKPGAAAPDHSDGCWAKDITPAIIETQTEQLLVSRERRDAEGRVIAPASYRTNTQQRMVQDTAEVWFRAPCPEALTVNFVATLQRALKARGLYLLPVTGDWNPDTAEAIRRFQAARGLDSPILSLAATRELGIISTDISTL